MSKFPRYAYVVSLIAACFVYTGAHASAETVHLSKKLTAVELRCLHDLLIQDSVRHPDADEIRRLITETSAARANLRGTGRRAFIFVIEDVGYCGTAGCLMLIGERRVDDKCHVLTAANADGDEVTVLSRRDHGYRRLYAPCELYFDGQHYQQVHEECPNADVHR